MSALFKNIPENIEKVIRKEYSAVMKEYKYLRPVNVKYTNTKVNLNQDYHNLSVQMDLSTTFDMLIKSKRINIYTLCQAAIESIQNQNSLMLVVSLRSLVERLAYYNYFVRQTKNYPISSKTSLEELKSELLPKVLRGLFQTSSEIRDFDSNVDIKTIDKKNLCFCVGNATEKKARSVGFQNVITAEGNVQNLKELILQNFSKRDGKIIYVSGETISVDLDLELTKEGYNIKRIINYFMDNSKKNSILNQILRKFKINYNINSYYLNSRDILKLYKMGMLIGNHGYSHDILSNMSLVDQEIEISYSKTILEKIIKDKIDFFCYPYGGPNSYNSTTLKLLKKNQYSLSFDVKPNDVNLKELIKNPYRIPRYDCNLF